MEPKIAPHHKPVSRSDEEVYRPVTWEPSFSFLKAAVVAIFLSGVLVTAAIYAFIPNGLSAALRTSTILLVGAAGWFFLWRKKLQTTVTALGVGMWCYVALMMFVGGGVIAPVQFVFPLVIFLLGWLVSTRVALIVAALTSVVTILAVVATKGGWLPQSADSPP
ncbi:MAG: hypothetical protein U5L73_09835 [Rhodoferax sp.]|uniref:hypothetical protein n=1 Tax=Rhodoferax sp. TaxID=50421 RepID=UPI002ACDDF73|nr:hypothetical protein [Rhodoferax sp.]MDZ7892041.1 hypothetical protein [Rhodoferax sp.]